MKFKLLFLFLLLLSLGLFRTSSVGAVGASWTKIHTLFFLDGSLVRERDFTQECGTTQRLSDLYFTQVKVKEMDGTWVDPNQNRFYGCYSGQPQTFLQHSSTDITPRDWQISIHPPTGYTCRWEYKDDWAGGITRSGSGCSANLTSVPFSDRPALSFYLVVPPTPTPTPYCQINSAGCGSATTNSIEISNITYTDAGWCGIPGAEGCGMTIWRATSSGGILTNVHSPNYGVPFSSSYTDTGLSPNTTYWYRVSCSIWGSNWAGYQGHTELFSCSTAVSPPPACGNGVLDPGEVCDPLYDLGAALNSREKGTGYYCLDYQNSLLAVICEDDCSGYNTTPRCYGACEDWVRGRPEEVIDQGICYVHFVGERCSIRYPDICCPEGQGCNDQCLCAAPISTPTPTPYHFGCVGERCVSVPGAGANLCQSDADCLTPTPTPVPFVESMMISNFADFKNGVEEPLVATKSWTLTAGDGVKTVYAKFKWSDGRWTTPVSDSITLQTVGPTPTPTSCPTHPTPDPCPGSTRCGIMECFDCSPSGECDWVVCSQYDYNGDCAVDILDIVSCNARCKTDGTAGACCSSSDQCQSGLRCEICYERAGSDPLGECVSEQVPTLTPTPEPGVANLTFRVSFQGIGSWSDKSEKMATLTLKQGGDIIYTRTVGISPDQNGIYTGRLTNITVGSYDILVKGWAHLQKKFTGVNLAEGENTKDWSDIELLTGDANGDGEVNILDFGILVENYLQGTSITDFNLDGQTNIQDFRFIAENYSKRGEE